MRKILLFIIFCLTSINAQAAIFLEQGKIVHNNIAPGSKIAGKLTVHNTGNEFERVKIYWEDFEYKSPHNGTKEFLPAGTSPLSSAAWVKFSPAQADLPPFGKAEISYVIDAPENFTGGRYGVMFFEAVDPQTDPKTGMNIVSRVGSLFFLESSEKSKFSGIDNFNLSQNNFTADFQNKGNIILIPDGIYYVMNSEGVATDRGEIPKIYVPPGDTAEYKFDFSNELASGRYTMVLTIDLKEQDVIVKEIDFEKDANSKITILGSRD